MRFSESNTHGFQYGRCESNMSKVMGVQNSPRLLNDDQKLVPREWKTLWNRIVPSEMDQLISTKCQWAPSLANCQDKSTSPDGRKSLFYVIHIANDGIELNSRKESICAIQIRIVYMIR